MPRSDDTPLCLGCDSPKRPLVRGPFCTSKCRLAAARRGTFLPTDAGRFDAKTERVDACLLFRGDLNHAGYGTFYVGRYGLRAHHFAWIRAHGPIPDDLDVLHNCPTGDDPACVEDTHLWLGTHQQNMEDMVVKGRAASGDRSAQRTRPEIRAVGERSGKAKLTAAQVIEIRATYQRGKRGAKGGGGAAAMARVYGVTSQNILDIVYRKTWRHI